MPATLTGAVQSCATPVRLSTHTGWNTPSASAARPELCPGLKLKLSMRAERLIIFPPLFDVSPPALALPDAFQNSLPPNAVGASETFVLGSQVSPPSSEARKRSVQPRLSGDSRRSYHETPTTPFLLTATVGVMLSGPLVGSIAIRSSLMTTGGDQ